MKLNIKFLTISCIVLGLCLTSCSKGEDGTNGGQGVQGITGGNGIDGTDGTDGADGANGTDGINGTDGNANAQTIIINTSGLSGSLYIFNNIEEITASTIENDAILSYYSIDDGNEGFLKYPIPGGGPNSFFLTRAYFSEGEYSVKFLGLNGVTSYETKPGEISEILIIIIKSTSSSSKSSSPLAELNAAGVNIKDYNAVMQYYGLN